MKVKVGFTESSKSVNAIVSIDDDVTTQEQLTELINKTKKLYEETSTYTKFKTLEKLR